jgi:hypothetical protein
MIDGVENDDGWMMVEDELLTTARRFTAHLHHAEYQRLKRLARSRPLDALSRPTVGRTEEQPSGSSHAKERGRDTRDGVKNEMKNLTAHATAPADDPLDEEEQDPYNEDPLLAELMNRPEQFGEFIGVQRDKRDVNQQVAASGVKRQRMPLVPNAENRPDKSLNVEMKNRHESSEATKSSTGYHKEPGHAGEPQSVPLEFENKSPKGSRGSSLPAKFASKLAKRKLDDNEGDDDKKSHHKTKENAASIADVPTFLL